MDLACSLAVSVLALGMQAGDPPPMSRTIGIPQIDLDQEASRHVIVDREQGQYLGHPSTVLLSDGATMFAVYPKGHGRGPLILKRSTDGGLTWSDRLKTPESWKTSKETPHIYPVTDAQGTKRLIIFSGLYPIRQSVSEDDGATWSELQKIGDYGGIVAMASMIETGPGKYQAYFHDDGRFIQEDGTGEQAFHVYVVDSTDGGLTWSSPRVIAHRSDVHLCEPGLFRSPDGTTLAALMRENSRTRNSWVIFSKDEGVTWTPARELPASLTGDRHQGRYLPDGRLFISFRDTAHESATNGDWVGWVGTFEDVLTGGEGEYRVRLKDNYHRGDCAYPAIEVLPDGTVVATTYGHWTPGEQPYILSVRFKAEELDAKVEAIPTQE